MRVSLFGLFLRCTSLMGPWPKRIQSILLISALRGISCFMMLMLYPFIYAFPCVLTLLSSVLDTCTHPASPLGFLSHSPGEFHLTPLDSHVQVMELGACQNLERVDSPSCWSEWRNGSVDLQQTVQSPILPDPLLGPRVLLLWLWASFCTVHTCTSLCILAFVPYWWCK